MNPIALSILLGFTAGAANVVGGAMLAHREWEQRYLKYFMALGAGFMLATSITEMVPASVTMAGGSGGRAGFLVLLGYLIIHFCEHVVSGHFHFGEETHRDEFIGQHKSNTVLLGLVIHAFFDGIAIGSGFQVSNWLGWIVFLAIFLHKIPEGFTVSSVMLASGRSSMRAFASSVILGAGTLLGVLTMVLIHNGVAIGLPISAGVTIYVAASDIVPEVNREPGIQMPLLLFVGVALLFVLDLLFHVHV
ncbi:MAG: ZIP family metal transporter [Candidatus Korobacteraceae bacterium]|jgi:ZIP family zinc transporter/zinc and cadmium transporter